MLALQGYYDGQKIQTLEAIQAEKNQKVIISEEQVVRLGLETFAEQNLDFVDCILYAYNQIKGYEIRTFDKKLQRLLGGIK